MKTSKYSVLAIALLAAGAVNGQVVLFTNFGPGESFNAMGRWESTPGGGGCSQQALAVRFTPSQSADFADAKLALANSQFSSAMGSPNQVSIDLKADAAGLPGATIESFSVTGLPTAPASAVITVTSVTQPALVAGTFYWLVVSAADYDTCDWWFYNSTGDNTDGTNMSVAFSGLPSGPWFDPATYPGTGYTRPAFQIDGIVTITKTIDAPYQVRYASNLTLADAVVNITNTGANGASLFGPGFGGPAGNICVNVYAFSPDEQLISCCSCPITPNGLVHLTANNDLVSNTLTGIRPDSIVIKLVATATGVQARRIEEESSSEFGIPTFSGTSCTNSAALAGTDKYQVSKGVLAWGTTSHSDAEPVNPNSLAITETPFIPATLSYDELKSITNRCTNIIGNGSTFGQCRSCRLGGLGGSKQ